MTGQNAERDWLGVDGVWLGSVVHHPRIEGYWMAMWKAKTIHDAGMKRYKTRSGAVARVQREVGEQS